MSKTEMLERSRIALADFRRLPPDEQFQQLVEWGAIDQQGEVIFGQHAAENRREDSSPANTRRLAL